MPKERDLAKELLGQIIEQPGQSSFQVAERLGVAHDEMVRPVLVDLDGRGFIEGKTLRGDNTIMEAQNLRATEEGRERFAQMSPPSMLKRIGLPALAFLAVVSVAVVAGIVSRLSESNAAAIGSGVGVGGLLLGLIVLLWRR